MNKKVLILILFFIFIITINIIELILIYILYNGHQTLLKKNISIKDKIEYIKAVNHSKKGTWIKKSRV